MITDHDCSVLTTSDPGIELLHAVHAHVHEHTYMNSTIMSHSEDEVQPRPPITVTQPGPHTNELFCYVVCKLHICTFDVIVKLCTDFYSLDDVREARELLSNRTVLPDGDSRINRRAANCKDVHMKDIV